MATRYRNIFSRFIYFYLYSLSVSPIHNLEWQNNSESLTANNVRGSRHGFIYGTIQQFRLEGLMKAKTFLSQESHCAGRDSNPAPPEYKSEALILWPTCSGYLSFIFLHIMLEIRIYKFRKNLQKEKANNVQKIHIGIGLYRKILSHVKVIRRVLDW
jgi:hypothetical protein